MNLTFWSVQIGCSCAELPSRIKSSISAYKYGDYWRYILNRSFINSGSCSLNVIAVHRQQQKQEPRKQWCLMMMAGILATYLFSCGLLRTQTAKTGIPGKHAIRIGWTPIVTNLITIPVRLLRSNNSNKPQRAFCYLDSNIIMVVLWLHNG